MMNEVQALNILTNLANEAQKEGLFKDINESGAVYTALLVLSQVIPQEQLKQPTNEVEIVEDSTEKDATTEA